MIIISFYLLLMSSGRAEENIASLKHIRVRLNSLYEFPLEKVYERKSGAILFSLTTEIFNITNEPDIKINHANLEFEFSKDFLLHCVNFRESRENYSLINSNLMGPAWELIFHNSPLREDTSGESKLDNCETPVMSFCGEATLNDFIPLTHDILPLNFECEINWIRIDIRPVLSHWLAQSDDALGRWAFNTRPFIFSVIIDERLMEENYKHGGDLSHHKRNFTTGEAFMSIQYFIESKF